MLSVRLVLFLVLAALLAAQAGRTPESERGEAANAVGKQVFTANCASCHGANARGGAQGGPNLLESALVRSDENGKQLGAFLKIGRPDKGMPAFNLPIPQGDAIAAFLHAAIASAAPQSDLGSKILVGDADAGKEFFNGAGNCSHCHSVAGDLRGVASKYSSVILQSRIVLPRGDGGYPGFSPVEPPTIRATLTFSGGQIVSGRVLFISDYYVTIRDASGQRHTFRRRGEIPKVFLQDPLQAHLDRQLTLTDTQMHDLTAYLATLR